MTFRYVYQWCINNNQLGWLRHKVELEQLTSKAIVKAFCAELRPKIKNKKGV